MILKKDIPMESMQEHFALIAATGFKTIVALTNHKVHQMILMNNTGRTIKSFSYYFLNRAII